DDVETPVYAARTMVAGERVDLNKAYFGTINGTVRYRVVLADSGKDGSEYASVTNKGILKAKKAGNVKVIPQGMDDGEYYDKRSALTVTILPKPVLEFKAPLTYAGQTLNAYSCFKNNWSERGYKVKRFASSNSDVAAVDQLSGIITAGKKSGTATITAYICEKGNDNAANSLKVSAKLKVKTPSFAKSLITMQTGQTLVVSMKNMSAQSSVQFASSDTNCLAVSAQTDDEGNRTGKAVLYARNTKQDDITLTATIDGKPYTCAVRIAAPQIKKKAVTIKVGKKATLALKNTKINKNDVVWVSENPSVAEVGEGGTVTGKSEGTVKVYTVTGGIRNECVVTVK
nr:Ig-like domain-containing protein [Lachnospiraceae bacterium]